ncbi:hypothetical protein GGX14DRAFT_545737 [Mycena pura]|uniref:Polyketide synthase n=1 Tax=Mycena pura TaxID=153505 RepID=A0AAD6UVR4_9AGAR|nr:hypothetical protein GGX14DRAFT_545737 [Mycena pura]
MPLPSKFASLLEVFIDTARDPRTADRPVLECGQDIWTYAALETVSSAMARELEETTGAFPKVAAVGENHPYLFALMLAVWKVGGIFIPIDAHVPPALLDGMLDVVKPTCVYLSASDTSNTSRVSAFDVPVRIFDTEHSTIPTLSQRYGYDGSAGAERRLPKSDAACLCLFTSSGFSRKSLKAVPLTHKFVLANCQSKLAWWRHMQPHKDLDGTRVLGWAPWSHVLSHMQDIGTVTVLTAGCYVFASVPSSYLPQQKSTDLTSKVISGIVNKNVTALAALPFVLDGLKAACESGTPEAQVLLGALRNMTMIECGGAVLDLSVADWAEQNDVPVVVGVGMTETGGAIFAGSAKEAFSGFSPQGLIPDAQFSLIGGDNSDEGELVVKSKLLPRGYIGYDDGSFSADEEGWVTFKTGDRYRIDDCKFTWLGRITDYIQMTSGESLDPRPLEESLRSFEFISNACIIGDTFLRGASTTVCAIIELADAQSLDARAAEIKVAQVLAPINADLPPPLRISMSSVLILSEPQRIPRTKKGEVSRKQIEDMFGAAMALMQRSATHFESNFEQVGDELTSIIGEVLGISDMNMLTSMTFAELGMTSLLAVKLAKRLNDYLAGRVVLPINICYVHIDVPSLTTAVRNSLSATSPVPQPMIDTSESVNTKEEVVIVGKAFRLPGGIHEDNALWDALMAKNNSIIADIPPDRWDQESFFPADISFRRAGLINIASYDHTFFGLTATEAFYVSPTMRVALEVAFEALENANIPISKVKGTSMGVFVATKDDGFETLLNAAHGFDAYTRFYGTGRAPSTASGRISYLLDIHGPSVTVDTACSGGIVCIDQAIAYLQSGAAESAIVCSSNTHCWPGSFMFLTAQGMTSPNSRCAAFTSDADGYVPSEGAVAFILKTRSAASRDGDQVLAIIKATAVSHNGRSQGLAAPNMKSQAALHRDILRKAKLDPGHINFIEAHGTGTSLGDLCEIQGINEAFVSAQPRAEGPLIISASKSALGHTEPSAGLVGMLSVLMAFKHSLVPGLVHLREDNANRLLDTTTVPLLISPRPVPIAGARPHRAVVLSYGFSGTLADIVLEGPQEPPLPPPDYADHVGPMIFAISAKTTAALSAYIQLYIVFLRNADERMFHAICYTACVGREHYKHRFACVATDLGDLIRQLESCASTPRPAKTSRGSLMFAFPGQGTQFSGMAAALAKKHRIFRDFILEFGHMAEELCGSPISKMLLETDAEVQDHIHSDVDQICIFIYQYSICRWLRELGMEANAVIGHSLGEITAAVIAGALTFEAGLDLVVTRGRLLRPQPGNPGGMAALACSEETISTILEHCRSEGDLSVSVFNGPRSLCVSGDSNDIDQLVQIAKQQNVKATPLRVDQGFHSPRVDSAAIGLRAWSESFSKSVQPLRITLYSTLLGAPILKGTALAPDHWADHVRKPVLFSKAAATLLTDQSVSVVLDIGPQMVAWSLLISNGCSTTSTIALSAKKGDDQEISFLSALAALYQSQKATPDFRALYAQYEQEAPLTTTSIPTYPFQRVRCYPSYLPSRNTRGSGQTESLHDDVKEPAPQSDLAPESTMNMSVEEVRQSLMNCVRDALEISPSEDFDDSDSLVYRGIDSITFAGLRKRVEERHGLNLSVVFWSDAFSIRDMVDNLVEQYTAS